MRVGELRAMLESLPQDDKIFVDIGEGFTRRPVTGVWANDNIVLVARPRSRSEDIYESD